MSPCNRKLKLEGSSSSYLNETIASLREENGLLKERIRELVSCYESIREDARILREENKSLMTVIPLLGKKSRPLKYKSQNSNEEKCSSDGVNGMSPVRHTNESSWVTVIEGREPFHQKIFTLGKHLSLQTLYHKCRFEVKKEQ